MSDGAGRGPSAGGYGTAVLTSRSPSSDRRDGAADVAIVGAGAAGLHVALEAAEAGGRVVVISRKPLNETASFHAQGGLAAAVAADDSPSRHAEDTFNAGRGICCPAAVEVLVAEAPAAVEALMRRGVRFDLGADGELALGLEGGHSARRIVHAGGAETGRALTSRLAALVAEHELIEVREGASALALWSDGERCHGVVTDEGPVAAAATVLATGGGAALWERTTNPRGAIGAGAVLAAAAGAELADLELCQFHPTALALPGTGFDGKLITEAVRGEGALLVGADGRRFTDELAPRDQVTAAILDRIAADGAGAVGLDLRPVPLERFPAIAALLSAAGIEPAAGPVPIAPAAHYLIGGVRTDLDGRSTLAGLLAVGEASCTGLHGANRLASNSLSECFVFGTRAAAAALGAAAADPAPPDPDPDPRFPAPTEETRHSVWTLAGPVRDPERLERLRADPYPLARLIAASALAREESRGVHRRSDRPLIDPALDLRHTVVGVGGEVRIDRWPPVGAAARV
ncbi:MAG: FAD-dependent oxidoreductase [Thermoleophilia bacterium]|nr:FAD-dependent oxidoreductase [Thermoleophilia bacterium]